MNRRAGPPVPLACRHVSPALAGVIAYGSGPIMATDDSYEVCLFGRGHGFMPDRRIGAAERNLETRRHG